MGPLFRRGRRSRKKRGPVPGPFGASPLSCEVRRGSSEAGGWKVGCWRRPPAPSPQPARARPHRPRTPGRPLRLPGAGRVTSPAPRRPLAGAGQAVVLTTRRRRRGLGAGAARWRRRSGAGRPALGSASGPFRRPGGNSRSAVRGPPRPPAPGPGRPLRAPAESRPRRRRRAAEGPGNLSRGEDPAPPPAGARRVPRCS